MADVQPPQVEPQGAESAPQSPPPAGNQSPSVLDAVRQRYEIPEDVTEDQFFEQFDAGLSAVDRVKELEKQVALLSAKQPQVEYPPSSGPAAPTSTPAEPPEEPTFEIDPEFRKLTEIPPLSDYAQQMINNGWIYQDPETRMWTSKDPSFAQYAKEVQDHYLAKTNFSNKFVQSPWDIIQKGAEPIVKRTEYELRKNLLDEVSKLIEDKLGSLQPGKPQDSSADISGLIQAEVQKSPKKFYQFENGNWKYDENGNVEPTPYAKALNEQARYLEEAGVSDPQKIVELATAYAEQATKTVEPEQPQSPPAPAGDKKTKFLERQQNGQAPVNRIQNLPAREVPELSPPVNRKGRGRQLYLQAISQNQ